MRTTIELCSFFFGSLIAAAWFLSGWMHRVDDGRTGPLDRSSVR